MKFLVIVRHAMDDIPIHLCDTKQEALVRAGAIDPDSLEHPTNPDYWNTDASTPMHVAIVAFDDGGSPISVENVRSFENEQKSDELPSSSET